MSKPWHFNGVVVISASRKNIWDVLTGADLMASWNAVLYGAPVSFSGDCLGGGEIRCFIGGDKSGNGFINRVAEYIPEEKLEFERVANLARSERQEFSGEDLEWKGLRQTFILADESPGIKLSITAKFPDSYADFSVRWQEVLMKIAQLSEALALIDRHVQEAEEKA